MKREKRFIQNLITCITVFTGIYVFMQRIAKKSSEMERLDDSVHLVKSCDGQNKLGIYENKVKLVIDKILSFVSLILLFPIFAIICGAVYLDDPGPIFFAQKRIGKDKQPFILHKFRTMKMSTPHDVPTHMLIHPEKYITRVGKVLRQTSLDELPQIWDIFRGKMSIVGPRPALWNQDDLVAERDKYAANSIMPGLTGLAQISGRDELEIVDKARIDGEYTATLRKGGFKAALQDIRCLLGTLAGVLKHDGIVEGGTGEIHRKEKYAEENNFKVNLLQKSHIDHIEDYGYKKKFNIDKSIYNQKKVLITGAGSYVGESFKGYVEENYSKNISIDILDMTNQNWRDYDFSVYDSVFHVAGIAHADVGDVDEETERKYYLVNTQLAIETAKKAQKSGVKQFVFMSSMIVYGDAAPYGKKKIIDEFTAPSPSNCYGDSKWQAEIGIKKLNSAQFKVAVLRPPMIYGKGSKGNYPILAKWAKRLPIFPNVENYRSMLYIENLCEFLALLILSGEGGLFFPQNKEYVKTSEMVKEISKVAGGNTYLTHILNPFVFFVGRIPGKIRKIIDKAFGYSIYSHKISVYDGIDYQVRDFKESIEAAEGRKKESKTVLILVNHDVVIYNFRLELVERLLEEGYEVHISSPYGERIDDLITIGAKYHEIFIDRHGMNPIADFFVLQEYKKLIADIRPTIVLGYTIKPNIYGAIAAKEAHIPFVANITGLGTAVENGGVKQKLTLLLYKIAFTNVKTVFFQNRENEAFFKEKKIALGKHKLLPGSGVNLERYPITLYPECGDGRTGEPVRFAFISRIMKEKGIEQYLAAAEEIRKRYPATEFHVCGFCEAEYKGTLKEMEEKGVVIYHGTIRNVAKFIGEMHCVVHPTYYPEGLSNILLEACSSGRPVITTDRAGCREVVDKWVNGYLIPEKDTKKLILAIEQFIELEFEQKRIMGLEARKLVEEQFDRQIVVEAYMSEVEVNESDSKMVKC